MLHDIAVVLNIIAALIAFGVCVVVFANWRADRTFASWAVLKWYKKWFMVARDSATMLLGYAQIVASGVLQNLDSLATMLHMPEITQILDKYFDPKIAGYVLLVSGMLIVWARGRTLVR